MKRFAFSLVVALSSSMAAAQNPSAESNWLRVQAINPHATITVKAGGHKTRCAFVSATPDALTCASGSKPPQLFDRASVTLVQQDHRSKSTLIGLGIGTAGGAAIGAGVGRNGSFVPRGAAAVVLGVTGAIIGTAIGAVGNFAHNTIYRAP